jgi:hypothetical protein
VDLVLILQQMEVLDMTKEEAINKCKANADKMKGQLVLLDVVPVIILGRRVKKVSRKPKWDRR